MDNSQIEKAGRVFTSTTALDPSVDISSVWSQVGTEKTADMSATERSAGLATLTDASYAQTPYYNPGYAGYGMYGTNQYYQQLASGVRAQTAAAAGAFSYGIGSAAAQGYYGSGYPGSGYNFSDYASVAPYYRNLGSSYGYGALTGAAGYTGTSLTADTSDLSFSIKDKKGKSTKKKKSGSCSPDGQQFARVFVWELTDICTLAYILANKQTFAQFHRSTHVLSSLTNAIVGLSFPIESLEEFDICNVEDAAHEDSLGENAMLDGRSGVEVTKRVATKYFAMRTLYQELGCKAEQENYSLVERCQMTSQKEEIDEAYRQMENIAPGRTDVARRCLNIVYQRSSISPGDKYANVVISTEKLPAAAAILLQCGLATSVPMENIYSSNKGNKNAVIEKITNRFGKKCSFIVISSDHETVHLAKKENIPVWPILPISHNPTGSTESLEKFFAAQSNYLLGTP